MGKLLLKIRGAILRHKSFFTFIVCFLLSNASVAYADVFPFSNEDVEPFKWEDQFVHQFKTAGFPVYVPTKVATSDFSRKNGFLFVSKLEVTRDHYLFEISRQRVRDGESRMLARDEMTMSAGRLPSYRKHPFSTYEIFEIPEGTIRFNGYKVNYFSNKKAFIWKDSGWEYLVWAENTNDAINTVKRVMTAIPKGESPVTGAGKGQFTAFDTKEGVRSDAGWSYDNGKTWYIITGRSNPEQLVQVLKSIEKLN